MCTVKLAPAARSAGPQLSVCGAAAFTEHGNDAPDWSAIAQVTPDPEPAGSGSSTVTPCASPVPVLETVTWNPIGSPAFTGVASAVLWMVMVAGWQVMLAEAWSLPAFVVVTVAVLLYCVHSVFEVCAVICTCS